MAGNVHCICGIQLFLRKAEYYGKWVFDDSKPSYSGYGCKKWLSAMWACRLTQRKDFEYEKLRWQPNECKIEEFAGSKFLHRSRVLNVGHEFGLVKARRAVRPDGWAYRFPTTNTTRFPTTNTTILFYWPPLEIWNRGKLKANQWVMHIGGVPNTNRMIAVFSRTISLRHFVNGDWNSGGTCDNTTPLSGGKEVKRDDSSDPLAAEAVNGTSF
ncbi:hypothetical protein RD792_006647 [Penstemon davidsonii]|uniref:Trichome birefringence-like N-terminal domain-containing protein n=1 Tax=Penstemon davidsonii TaxID=160366 RepID=A0ABR0DC25_9LAMI|nr:hypothetical protein RD792_006647 [Penstemon davidsonii]